MVRLAWPVHKEVVAESDKVVELEEFLRSVAGIDDEPKQQVESSPSKARMSLAVDDLDDALEALDDEVLGEEFAADEPVRQPLESDPLHEAREVSPPPFNGSHANAAMLEAALQPPHQGLGLDQRSDEEPREAPPLKPRPRQADELPDEALSEIFPTSDPKAVVLGLDPRSDEEPREAPPLEPRPPQVDELLDEALSETFPASDPIAPVLGLDQRSGEEPPEAPPFEPRPHQVDELLDEALSETFPASDPIAVSST